jgi:hypothetical protein
MLNMDDSTKHALDFASIFTAIGTLLSWLPHLAALFTIVWTGIRIYETKTVQNWLVRRRNMATLKPFLVNEKEAKKEKPVKPEAFDAKAHREKIKAMEQDNASKK